MAEPHVISALAKKRAQLAGDIEHTQRHLQQLVQDLEHLDNTLLLFDPDYRIEAIRPKAFRPPENWSKRGEMTRIILDVLRKAAEPLTSGDIAIQLMEQRALDTSDSKMVRLMTKRVGVALRHLRDKDVARSEQGAGMNLLWSLTR